MSTEIQGSLNFTWKRMEKHRKCLWGWQAYPNFCLGGGKPRNTDPHGEAENRREGDMQARGC